MEISVMSISSSIACLFKIALILCAITIISVTQADRVSDKIYLNLQSSHFCSRRLNGTHQMGCTSELGGNSGIVWIVQNDDDLDHILKSGPTPPYIVVLQKDYYTRKNILDFKSNLNRVSGVIFDDTDHGDLKMRPKSFSPEDVCPNRNYGLYANDSVYGGCKKNNWIQDTPISGLLFDDIPFPIFLINDKQSIEAIRSCFSNHNLLIDPLHKTRRQNTYPLCGMQLDSFMIAARDSKLCLNSGSMIDELLQSNGRRCYAVHNHNIFAYLKSAVGPLKPTNDVKVPDIVPPQSIVLLLTKLSSISMFSEMSPGADSTITSIVTLLAVAEALNATKSLPRVVDSKRNIAFAFLDSEPFDYTGSTRMVNDMLHNSFPLGNFSSSINSTSSMLNINLSSIDYVINLDQMANYPNADSIYIHVDPGDAKNPKVDKINSIMKRVAKIENVKFETTDNQLPLPPTPVHRFIEASRGLHDEKLAGLVLSNYNSKFSNLFYHSIYDDLQNVFRDTEDSKNQLIDHIAQVSKFIARSLFEIAFPMEVSSEDIKVNKDTIAQLLDCYLINADCPMFTKAWHAGQKLPNSSIETYKDPTKRSDDMNGAITEHLLAYFIGDRDEANMTECFRKDEASYEYLFRYVNDHSEPIENASSGICIRSQVIKSSSESPAYYEPVEGVIDIDLRYPAWTVSLNNIRNPVRIYLQPSPLYQWCIFLTGIVITIASVVSVNQIRSHIIKNLSPGSSAITST